MLFEYEGCERQVNAMALERAAMNVDGTDVRLSPGMAVTVEIKTGKRRVIEYFLSPLIQATTESMRER